MSLADAVEFNTAFIELTDIHGRVSFIRPTDVSAVIEAYPGDDRIRATACVYLRCGFSTEIPGTPQQVLADIYPDS